MGSLSPKTRNAQVSLYQSGDVDYLVATDAIGMGINMDLDQVFFSNIKKACKDNINKIRLTERFINEHKATPKPRIENPIAYQRFTEEACVPSQPQIIPPKKATTMPPYIVRT